MGGYFLTFIGLGFTQQHKKLTKCALIFIDDFNLEPISIIGNGSKASGQNQSSPNLSRPQAMSDSDILSSGDDLPPPPGGKRKPIVAKRPNNFIWSLQVRYSYHSHQITTKYMSVLHRDYI